METERLKIFDQNKNEIGVATREDVHRLGYWHETFHCWFASRENGIEYIYFQRRSTAKKEYPGLLDITAAGHLLASETVEDGIREVNEELGISMTMSELVPLGIFKCSIKVEGFIDNEFSHVFLYHQDHPIEGFKLQMEEVEGIMKTEFDSFYELWMGTKDELMMEGFIINGNGERVEVSQRVGRNHFTPNVNGYYEKLVKRCRKFFNGEGVDDL